MYVQVHKIYHRNVLANSKTCISVYKVSFQFSVTESQFYLLFYSVQPIQRLYLPYSLQINEYCNDACTRIKWLYVTITRKVIFGISVILVTEV